MMRRVEENLMAYLNDQLSQKNRAEVEEWIGHSNENKIYFNEIKKLYNASSLDLDGFTPDVEKAWRQVSTRAFGASSKQLSLTVWKVFYRVAAVVLLTTAASFYAYQLLNQQDIVITTADQQLKYHRLPDGSLVTLNENSELSYNSSFNESKRHVRLNGQAYFRVSANKTKPFIIKGHSVDVKVVGTAFDFISTYDQAIVSVVEGVVEMSAKDVNDEVTLTRNEQGKLLKNGHLEQQGIDVSIMAWRAEELVFQSSPLVEVVKKLSNHFDVKIEVEEKIETCLITSSFKDQSLSEILSVLEAIANIKSQQNGKLIRLTGPGC